MSIDPSSQPPPTAAAKLKLSQPLSLNRPCLVVSVHDVSPFTQPECDQIIAELAELGLKRCSLLVVPNHHGRGHSFQDEDFCTWLTGLVEAGHEAVIHGYTHFRQELGSESWQEKITTRWYTAGEGEFYDIDRESAADLVCTAREEFREVGLEAEGFIAPAWLLSAEGEEAVRECGFQYTTRLRDVVDLQTHRTYRSQSLVWSVRSAWRRKCSLVWNQLLYRRLKNNLLMRISIHPADLHCREVWRQIRALVAAALRERAPYTYERWINRQRAIESVAGGRHPGFL